MAGAGKYLPPEASAKHRVNLLQKGGIRHKVLNAKEDHRVYEYMVSSKQVDPKDRYDPKKAILMFREKTGHHP